MNRLTNLYHRIFIYYHEKIFKLTRNGDTWVYHANKIEYHSKKIKGV